MELRLHGRGGQGGVTCAKIIAAAYARQGLCVQTFGDYAGERSGAPVRAYTRVSATPIENRNKVYAPDHVVVLDEHLLGPETTDGLALGGTLLVNSGRPLAAFAGQWPQQRLAVVDATQIARRHGIGTRSVVIVNTTLAGAFARLFELPWEVLEATYRDLGFFDNLAAAREAWDAVQERPAAPRVAGATSPLPRAAPGAVEPLTDHVWSAPTGLRTGSWSSQRPVHRDHLAPCSASCPAGNDVVGFVNALSARGAPAAAEVLARTTPFSGVCGRVCPAPCMQGCNRGEVDGPVHVRGLERWVADQAPAARGIPHLSGRRRQVAIVGGGPAGLSAAYVLARAGHGVTVFEGERELGGVLVTGIPAYRLPRAVVKREIAAILELGVHARCGERLDGARLAALAAEHDAVILATGLQRPRGLDCPGARLRGIEQGLSFLHYVNQEGGAELDGHVVVLGGGNTAIDCARSALRSGARRVTVAYRRSRAEMPAIPEETEQALEEGVELLELCAPVGFGGQDRATSVELAAVELGEPDGSGRRSPVVTSAVRSLACDHVLLALGQSADLSFLPAGWTLCDGRIHENGRATNVHAAGDLATGDGTVAHAIGSGRRAAGLVLTALGETAEDFERPDRSRAVPVSSIRVDRFGHARPARERLEPPALRALSFVEVGAGLAEAHEAHRCFACGHCTGCDTCLVHCPEGVVSRRRGGGYEIDAAYCKGCGICVRECPRAAMEMESS